MAFGDSGSCSPFTPSGHVDGEDVVQAERGMSPGSQGKEERQGNTGRTQ